MDEEDQDFPVYTERPDIETVARIQLAAPDIRIMESWMNSIGTLTHIGEKFCPLCGSDPRNIDAYDMCPVCELYGSGYVELTEEE